MVLMSLSASMSGRSRGRRSLGGECHCALAEHHWVVREHDRVVGELHWMVGEDHWVVVFIHRVT